MADQGGGLIVVAGPIYTGAAINGWTQNRAMTPIRNLYPVEFPRRMSSAESGVYSTAEPWPLDFTREGLEADFLMLGDSATAGTSLGGISRRLSAIVPCAKQNPARRFMRDFPIPARPRAAISRYIWPDNFTAREECFTWAAAKCGGSARSTNHISNNFTQS